MNRSLNNYCAHHCLHIKLLKILNINTVIMTRVLENRYSAVNVLKRVIVTQYEVITRYATIVLATSAGPICSLVH